MHQTGFATTQEAYDDNVKKVFENLDKMEKIMSESKGPVRSPFQTKRLIDLY